MHLILKEFFFQSTDFANLDDTRNNVLFISANHLPLRFLEKGLNQAYLKNPPTTLPNGKIMSKNVIEEHEKCNKFDRIFKKANSEGELYVRRLVF